MDQQGSAIAQFVPFIFLMVIFYFVVILPQKKQQKQHKEMLSKLEKGDKVVTFSGIHGTVMSVADDSVVVRVDDVAKIKFDKSAISHKVQ